MEEWETRKGRNGKGGKESSRGAIAEQNRYCAVPFVQRGMHGAGYHPQRRGVHAEWRSGILRVERACTYGSIQHRHRTLCSTHADTIIVERLPCAVNLPFLAWRHIFTLPHYTVSWCYPFPGLFSLICPFFAPKPFPSNCMLNRTRCSAGNALHETVPQPIGLLFLV